jgi:NitT/TauT family transport system substrate-binding protein
MRTRLTLLAAAFLASTEAAAIEKISFTIPSLAGNSAQFVAAKDKGYFKDEGLEVEFIVAAGTAAVSALVSGSVPYSAAASSAVTAILRGAELKVIEISHSHAPYTLRSLVPEIRTLADMKGKQINITSRGGTQEIAMIMLLDKHGLPRNHVGFSPMGSGAERIAGLISGTQQLAILSRNDAGQLRDAGRLQQGHLLANLNKEFVLPTGGIATSTAELGANPDRVRRFLRAVWKGTIYIRGHKDETIEMMHRRAPRASRDTIVEDVEGALEDLDADGEVSFAEAEKELSIRAELMKLPADKVMPAEKVYDFARIRQVVRELRDWKPER